MTEIQNHDTQFAWPVPGHELLSVETLEMLEKIRNVAPESAISIAGMRVAIERRKIAIAEVANSAAVNSTDTHFSQT